MAKKESEPIEIDLKVSKKDEVVKKSSETSLTIRFDEIFGNERYEMFNVFSLSKKPLYATRNELIATYINYFIKHYDYDNELINAYLHLKFMIDDNKKYSKKTFIVDLYDYFMSDTMVEKIEKMVQDLYNIDLVTENKSKRKRKKNNESLQFVNEHGEILMAITVGMKIMIPVVTHYMYKNKIKHANGFILKCFFGLLEVFERDHNIYNKLYETVLSRIKSTLNNNKTMWEQGEIRGINPHTQTTGIIEKLITDIIPKYIFNGNVVHLNSKCIDNNIGFNFSDKYDFDYVPVIGNKESSNDEGLTGFEKMEMTTTRFDESMIILGKINLKQTIKLLCEQNFVKLKKKEISYYMENLDVKPFQKELVFQYFAKYFGSPKELNSNKIDYCKIVIILKKMLTDRGYIYLQHLLTGNVEEFSQQKKSVIRKDMSKIVNSPRFTNLQNYKYDSVKNLLEKNETIQKYISMLLYSKISLVDYMFKEDTGRMICALKDKETVCDEFLRFIEEI